MDWLSTQHLTVLLTLLALSPHLPETEGLRGPSALSLKCPARVLKGGRVRIRSKGRVAKYVCLRGSQVLGDKYSTCVRGKWDSPVPVCINTGCLPIDVPHGQVLETYRGALVTVHCDPGYSLVGSQSLYCNGAVWNDTAPICREIQVKAQKWCDFETEDLCGWTHDLNHDFDWRRHNFATPSGHVGTGPSFDHTLGPSLGGYYMYLEVSSPRLENDTARLFSPVFPAITGPGACFIFWYHMFGITTGTLNVYLHEQDTIRLFSKVGDQGNQWIQAVIPLNRTNSSFQIVIEGVRGSGYEGDMAIDDVKLTEGGECVSPTSTTTGDDEVTMATEESVSSCEGRCSIDALEPSLCECTTDCIGNNTCCPDYLDKCSPSTQHQDISQTDVVEVTTVNSSTLPSFSTSRIENPIILPNITNNTPALFNFSVTSIPTSNPHINSSKDIKITSEVDQINLSKSITSSLNASFTTVAVTLPTTPNMSTSFGVPQVNQTTRTQHEQTTTASKQSTNAELNKTISVTATPSPTTPSSKTSNQSGLPTTVTKPPTKLSYKPSTVLPLWNPQQSISTRMPKVPQKPKIEFVTPPPPVIFRFPKKTIKPFTKTLHNESLVIVPTTATTQFQKKNFNKTKKLPQSKNDVFHPFWSENKPTAPTLPPLGPNPDVLSNRTTKSPIKLILTTPPQLSSKMYARQENSSKNTEAKWKTNYKHRADEAPVHAQYAISTTPSSHMTHILVLVSGVLLILATALASACVLRRRKINRRRMEDDELDIQFIASDDILDFTLARPSIEDIQMSETRR